MPTSFPDWRSLENAARVHKFRTKALHETEAEYRAALADHVRPLDFIESHEIRTGKGWDQWNDEDRRSLHANRVPVDPTKANQVLEQLDRSKLTIDGTLFNVRMKRLTDDSMVHNVECFCTDWNNVVRRVTIGANTRHAARLLAKVLNDNVSFIEVDKE